LAKKIRAILDELKPEAVYFSEYDGLRTAMIVVDVQEASKIPTITEPWFLAFEADVLMRVAMTPEDLEKSGIEKIGNKWS
jgi:hypothetical protein